MSETSDGTHAFLSSWSLSSFDLGDFAGPREGFVVVVADPLTNEIDCYGPYADRGQADHEAAWRSAELTLADLPEVIVTVAHCTHDAPPASPPRAAPEITEP